MNDTSRPTRTADLVALAQATDAYGNIDLTAFQAQRLILLHQFIDGLDARSLVNELVSSPAYADPKGREQIGPLLEAISSRLSVDKAQCFTTALELAGVGAGIGHSHECDVERPVSSNAGQTEQLPIDGQEATPRLTDGTFKISRNNRLKQAFEKVTADNVGFAREPVGIIASPHSRGFSVLAETVDIDKFKHRFSTDIHFRQLIVGATAIYASNIIHDASEPLGDTTHQALEAWIEWAAGLAQAMKDDQEHEYLIETDVVAVVEIIATILPPPKLTKLARLARAVDATGALAPSKTTSSRHWLWPWKRV